mmetsp:Transcript_829/g.1612  ORF Transcript_829/g.1612 Transcript_829/m.1612 type:complete len:1156 (-) Transcript_829:50-3517(-)|eukprot:CAMPEP_0175132642 /NCGR_PEP_ID=MMETSP0087-20121206/7181_1 /TAXON_ID=136419 /ORGANISM="Unknown Unknown, Strain D1" /LENGTH=1155 /DNA_ID=CAMNT_0016415005 /DNA_START=22 /DNA_END=3489 /DNA_ORIENTATION=-
MEDKAHRKIQSSSKKKASAHVESQLPSVVKPHVQSFNFTCNEGLKLAVSSLSPQSLDARPESGVPAMSFWIEDCQIGYPVKNDNSVDHRLFPNECRELGVTYEAPLSCTFAWKIDGNAEQRMTKRLGNVPIMVKSSRCHLEHADGAQLIQAKEEVNEMGGYFILNGNERIIRLLIVPRRHHISALLRPSMVNRGKNYTPYATTIRCVQPDQSSKTITLHYLTNGSCNVRFSFRKQEFFIPAGLLLKSFISATDRQIYDHIVGKGNNNTFIHDRAEMLLSEASKLGVHTPRKIYKHLGKTFRTVMRCEASESNEDVGKGLVEDNIFIHCQTGQEKFDLLIQMIRKLYALVQGTIKPENPDALNNHEILLPGHIYLMLLKEKMNDMLAGIKSTVLREIRIDSANVLPSNESFWKKMIEKQPEIGTKIRYFLVTGNLVSTSGLDLMQVSGFTIVADKLNWYRYMSHFRSVHRGQFFTTMKTTTVRKLLPESWGFMCPVHTPDGGPCGLLNHLAAGCEILTHNCPTTFDALLKVLVDTGLTPALPGLVPPHSYITVMLDGKVAGSVSPEVAPLFAKSLRSLKVQKHPSVPYHTEIATNFSLDDAIYPCISISTGTARMIRPVFQLTPTNSPPLVEWIGAQEQVYMEIACTDDDFRKGETTHKEITPTAMLSVIASMTPFSDFNQSPRNMYQCQMGKQTMGTPYHSHPHRVDNKVYRVQTPQRPVVRNNTHEQYNVDEYPLGCNAVVAVISYTGYDMEDAMIISKGAADRGFGHGSVYKYKITDLDDFRLRGEPIHHTFADPSPPTTKGGKPAKPAAHNKGTAQTKGFVDKDGLPLVGTRLVKGDPIYAVKNDVNNSIKVASHKDNEPCTVEEVRALGDGSGKPMQKLGIKFRYNRNPIIGDKFSSRHGQKGVLSQLWPTENMPFSESGMSPDIIINPHAFPSRMTIGMLIESMAGKAGCCHAAVQDGTPFRFNEKDRAVDYFGKQLVSAGYNHMGTECFYSGITGVEMKAEIFLGVVYYQRLRHMVSDKSQVRSTGPTNALTRQPVKGRKLGGGIRFGEMERDSLISHGTSYLLNDRLMMCSDYSTAYVCCDCGSMVSTSMDFLSRNGHVGSGTVTCRLCSDRKQESKKCALVSLPYVFSYLTNELAAMNIRLALDIKQ